MYTSLLKKSKYHFENLFQNPWRWLGYASICTLALLFLIKNIQASNHQYLQQIELNTKEKALQIDEQIINMQNNVLLARRLFLQNLVSNETQHSSYLVSQLTIGPKGIHLDNPKPPLTLQNSGNLTGIDSNILRNPKYHSELQSALQLGSLFNFMSEHLPNLSWIYYTSTSGFMYLYPHVPSRDFSYHRGIDTLSFYQIATPARNTKRELLWTPPYEDGAGKGRMITASIPVEMHNQWIGIMSIDITLNHLEKLLASQNHNSHLSLSDTYGQTIIQYNWHHKQDPNQNLNFQDLFLHGEWITKVDLQRSHFKLYQAIYIKEWIRAILVQSSMSLFIFFAILFFTILIELNFKFQSKLLKSQRLLKKAKEEADAANEAKGIFLSTMSHEIRTPMNAIINIIEHLKEENFSSDKDHPIEVASQAANHLLHLVNDVLDLSKIEANKLILESKAMDLNNIIINTTQMFLSELKRKNIELIINLDKNSPHYIKGDSTRLRQVIVNILGNAIKFTPKGQIKILSNFNDSKIKLEIIDQGIGISPEQMQKLFKPFAQAELQTSLQYGGTGLGLVISQKLIELMGGSIKAHSALGQGTNFTIEIPAEPCNPTLKETPTPPLKIQNQFKILVVEDNAPNQLVISIILKKLGWSFEIAQNGADAIQKIEKNPSDYHLVLMDMQMPIMNGIEATKHIRNTLKMSQLPILAMTANAFKAELDLCIESGMNDAITKPIHRDELKEKIEAFLIPGNSNNP